MQAVSATDAVELIADLQSQMSETTAANARAAVWAAFVRQNPDRADRRARCLAQIQCPDADRFYRHGFAQGRGDAGLPAKAGRTDGGLCYRRRG